MEELLVLNEEEMKASLEGPVIEKVTDEGAMFSFEESLLYHLGGIFYRDDRYGDATLQEVRDHVNFLMQALGCTIEQGCVSEGCHAHGGRHYLWSCQQGEHWCSNLDS